MRKPLPVIRRGVYCELYDQLKSKYNCRLFS